MYKKIGLETSSMTFKEIKKLKRHPQNRIARPQWVKKILAAMEKGEYISPITVNRRTMTVMDGEHRREAMGLYMKAHPEFARMKFEVVTIDIPKEDEFAYIISCNAKQMKWNGANYINAFAEAGNENYLKLRNFMKSCILCHVSSENNGEEIVYPKVSNTLALLDLPYRASVYKSGEIVISDDDIARAMKRASEVCSIMEAIDPDHTVAGRSITYLIGSWVSRERIDIGLSSDHRLNYIVTHKKELRRYIRDSGNKLQKNSDWNNLFNRVSSAIYAEQNKQKAEVA